MKILIGLSLVLICGSHAYAGAPPPPPQRAVPYSQTDIQYVRCGLRKNNPQNASCGRETAIEAHRRGRSGPPITIPYSIQR